MLQNVRDNMKGTAVSVVVFLFFIVPLVLTGVGDGSFLGSVAGTDAASVDGKTITNAEVNRAVVLRRQQLLNQQGVDASAEFLREENLRGPIIEQLTNRAALIVAAQEGGMGVSEEVLDQQILAREEFQVGGQFDPQTYRRLLSNVGYTPAGYRAVLVDDELVNQSTQSIALSAFATERELDDLVSLIQQKRSFFTVKVEKKLVEDEVALTDEDVASYYDEFKTTYLDPENMTAQYIELSVDAIADTLDIAEETIREEYESEVQNFQATDEFEIAHILIEEKDNQDAVVQEVAQKIKDGEDFAALVGEYSDDSGSKDAGGNLGVLIPGAFPEPFEQAVYLLEEGQVSDPVETDAGTHFIKVLSKVVNEVPTFEERRAAIERVLREAEAETIYAESLDQLGELTFSAQNLDEAAETLNLTVQTTEPFTRTTGTGIASTPTFRNAAFSDEVLNNDYNSEAIELSNRQTVVLRKATHAPERIKTLDEVREEVVTALTELRIDEKLSVYSTEVKNKINAGEEAESVAGAAGHEFKSFSQAERTAADAGFDVIRKAFSMPLLEGGMNVDHIVDREGNHIVIGLTEIQAGQKGDMPDQQFAGLSNQLGIQLSNFESASYQSQVVANAEIEVY